HFSGDVSTDTSYGIIIYKSYVDVLNNYIDEHTTGVACLDKSNSKIKSEDINPIKEHTQHIINNKVNQVYALPGSFPYEFEYNAIYSDDTDYSLVYYKATYVPSGKFLDVRNNFWGEDGLDTVNGLDSLVKVLLGPCLGSLGPQKCPG
ncbi:MAG: hypothetical protein KAT48_05425, partial [Bacteroidales bacterium]|nr:hypothetical protein [Bacteroidales bacterium]